MSKKGGISEIDLAKVKKTLHKLEQTYKTREVKKLLKVAAKPIIGAMKQRAPVFKGVYSEKQKMQPGGRKAGRVKQSIKAFPLKGSKSIFVGVRKTKTKDPYYAFWNEFGAPAQGIKPKSFIKAGFEASKGQSNRLIMILAKDKLKRYERENAI